MSHHTHVHDKVDRHGNKYYVVNYMDWSTRSWRSKEFTDKAKAEKFARKMQR